MRAEDCGRARGRARGRAIWNIPPGSCTETDANIVVRKLHGSDANEPSVRAQIVIAEALAEDQMFHIVSQGFKRKPGRAALLI